jgi:Ferritin-like domain
LGQDPIGNCQFNFDSALTDVATMAATARVLENVGVGAYLGGATLIDDPVLLDSAASILTVEARHQTVLNILNGGSAIPSAFDIPLTPSEVLALAGPFISGPRTSQLLFLWSSLTPVLSLLELH